MTKDKQSSKSAVLVLFYYVSIVFVVLLLQLFTAYTLPDFYYSCEKYLAWKQSALSRDTLLGIIVIGIYFAAGNILSSLINKKMLYCFLFSITIYVLSSVIDFTASFFDPTLFIMNHTEIPVLGLTGNLSNDMLFPIALDVIFIVLCVYFGVFTASLIRTPKIQSIIAIAGIVFCTVVFFLACIYWAGVYTVDKIIPWQSIALFLPFFIYVTYRFINIMVRQALNKNQV